MVTLFFYFYIVKYNIVHFVVELYIVSVFRFWDMKWLYTKQYSIIFT